LFVGPAMVKHFGTVWGPLGTLAVQAVTLFLDVQQVQIRKAAGRIAYWPKSMHVANAFVWVFLLGLASAVHWPQRDFAGECGALSDTCLALFVLGSILVGHPFTQEHAAEQMPETGRCLIEGDDDDGFAEMRKRFKMTATYSALLWLAILVTAACLQDFGFRTFEEKSVGEIVLCHLVPPLLILIAARKSFLWAQEVEPLPLILGADAVTIVPLG